MDLRDLETIAEENACGVNNGNGTKVPPLDASNNCWGGGG